MTDARQIERLFDLLWPICRSITGDGLRRSLKILSEVIPLELNEVPSGTKCFDWEIPPEWNIQEAYLEFDGKRVVDFRNHNLHVVNYSTPIDQTMSLEELQPHLHSLPTQPVAIPYVTSYYHRNWGFCLTHIEREALRPGKYRAVIKSTLAPGSLTYGQTVLKATQRSGQGSAQESEGEILLSTYLCHPSMANNELSGPLVLAFLYQKLKALPQRRYDYRFYFGPETIGAIAFLSQWGEHLKKNCVGGLVATCCGDDHNLIYKKSRRGNSAMDRSAMRVLKAHTSKTGKPHQILDFFPLGSDERQYCSPGFDLPVGSLMRSAYDYFPEYHTSLDNKDFISFEAIVETIGLYSDILLSFETSKVFESQVKHCEPMFSKKGLYSTYGHKSLSGRDDRYPLKRNALINWSDGEHSLVDIAEKVNCNVSELDPIAEDLVRAGLLKEIKL